MNIYVRVFQWQLMNQKFTTPLTNIQTLELNITGAMKKAVCIYTGRSRSKLLTHFIKQTDVQLETKLFSKSINKYLFLNILSNSSLHLLYYIMQKFSSICCNHI